MDGFANFISPLEQRDLSGGGAKRGEVALVGCVGDLGPAFEVRDAFAQNTPGFLAFLFGASVGADLSLAKDSKVAGLVNGRFDAQDRPLFVIHLDGVGVERVFDANAFGPVFQIADDFPFEVAGHSSMRGDPVS